MSLHSFKFIGNELLYGVSPSFYILIGTLLIPLLIVGLFPSIITVHKQHEKLFHHIKNDDLETNQEVKTDLNQNKNQNKNEANKLKNRLNSKKNNLSNSDNKRLDSNDTRDLDKNLNIYSNNHLNKNQIDDSSLKYHVSKFNSWKLNRKYNRPILWSLFLGICASLVTFFLIPQIQLLTFNAGLAGKDLNKGANATIIPESLGIVPGTVYASVMCLVTLLVNKKEYFAGLFCSLFMLYLGFADDVLELRWRYKLVLPALATLPLIVSYEGITTIIIPKPFRYWFNLRSIDLGLLYLVYMWLVSIYCSNAINIFAGINGLEVSQALIIACAILLHNLIELRGPNQKAHVFSVVCMIPFILTTIPLLYYNWFPARVFVGDTFTYYAGMTLAVVGILSHFSKTLMLFFIPQWLNFFYSLPQLFGIVACPRHRIPIFNQRTGLMESSGNATLLNLALEIFGPMTEENLCLILCVFQILCCIIGFIIRYKVSKYFY